MGRLASLYAVQGESGTAFTRYVTAEPTADLSLTKTASPAAATVGDAITYTVKVSNTGPQAAANAVVTDALPPNTTLISAAASRGSCSGSTTVTCSLGNLADGASATLTITVAAARAGTATNAATVKSDWADPNSANNTATASTDVSAPAAIAETPAIADSPPTAPSAPVAAPAPQTKCVVPTLRNKTLDQARRLLAKHHCRLGTVRQTKASARRTGTVHVLAQSVRAGREVTAGRRVAVTIGRTGPLRRRLAPHFTG